jgi:copper chaperone CopZ
MKKIRIAALALALQLCIVSAAGIAGAAEGSQQIVVTGMTCGSCAASIKKAFMKNPGVKEVSVDVKSGKVLLTFLPEKTMSESQIRETVKGAGYEVKSVAPAPQS